MTSFPSGPSKWDLFDSLEISFGYMISYLFRTCGGVAKTIPDPWLDPNFNTPWILNDIPLNLSRVFRPNMTLCLEECRTTTKSMRAVLRLFFSWLVSVNGKWIIPRGHMLCPMNPVSWPGTGFKPPFHLSGSNQKQCSYMIYAALLVSTYMSKWLRPVWTHELLVGHPLSSPAALGQLLRNPSLVLPL